ncbi:MAG TPA: type III secretion system inner membrane ring subunit SctD [Geminicoccaceae bacterium]|nr:type III secretion system inner membrane ring subunit SctD [Geminicoccus sp.]HMU48207.1 type III secretion system inner membrane ring subunit SctD [Geminicoccaceae bacterium]
MQDKSGPYYILKVLSGPHLGAEVQLAAGDYRLGRDDSCDIVLSDRSLSGQHALFAISADGVRVQNLAGEVRLDHQPHQDAARLLPFFTVIGLGTTHVAVGPEAAAWPELVPPAQPVTQPAQPKEATAALADAPVPGSIAASAEPSLAAGGAPSPPPAAAGEPVAPDRRRNLRRWAARAAALLLLLATVGGFAANRDGLLAHRAIEPETPVEPQPPSPRDMLTAMLAQDDLARGLQVTEDRRGRLVVEGHVDSTTERDLLAEKLKQSPEPVQIRIVAGDQMVATARDTLAALGYDLDVGYAGGGALKLAGYVPEASDLQRAVDIVQRDVAGLAGIRNDVMTDRSILSGLEDRLRKADLGEAIRLRLEANKKITARGTVRAEDMPAWTTIQAAFDRDYGRYLEIVSQVTESRRDNALPGVQLNVRAVGFGDLPYVILGDGQKYLEGSVLTDGWTIQRIRPKEVVLSKGGQLYVHEL